MGFAHLEVGSKVVREFTPTKHDVACFMELSGDRNRIHHDETYAAQTTLGSPVAHGALLFAYISGVAAELLGDGAFVYEIANGRFLRPVLVGATVQIEVTIAEKHESSQIFPNGSVGLRFKGSVGGKTAFRVSASATSCAPQEIDSFA